VGIVVQLRRPVDAVALVVPVAVDVHAADENTIALGDRLP